MKKISLIILLSIILFFGCNQKPKPAELYEKYRSSVVLILNSYYFKTSFDNGLSVYYTTNNGELSISLDEEEIADNADMIFGTGFFISDKGEIATNRHVIYPDKKTELFEQKINKVIYDIIYDTQQEINEIRENKENIA
ncbi:MAG: serine protease, partial [Prevotellaceae bacterium]|nr:serine protease [Prevotellaceae bacterium]